MLEDSTGKKAKSAHSFLPFYNNPVIKNASSLIFAARMGPYKAHWITSPGLGGGRYACNSSDPDCHGHHSAPTWQRPDMAPLLFNVEFDPSEMLPIASPPKTVLAELASQKKAYEAALQPRAIDARFGFEWALCCGVGCEDPRGQRGAKIPCDKCQCKNVPLPQPTPSNIDTARLKPDDDRLDSASGR